MFIQTETTPNPATLKFLPGRDVLIGEPRDFRDETSAAEASPLASALFVSTGVPVVNLVMVGMVLGPQLVADQKVTHSFDFIHALPVPRTASALAWYVVCLVASLPAVAISLGVAVWRYEGLPLAITPDVVPALLLTGFAGTMLGYAIAHAITNPMVTRLVTQFLVFALFAFTPILFAASQMPPWLATVNSWLPFRHMADLVRDFMPPSAGEVLVPTFGVDTAIFKPAAREPSQQRPVAGVFVGNVSYAKGVDVLLRALAKTPGDWRFGFVGSGPDLAAMRNLAGELRLGERLTWHGRRPTHQVPHLLGEADFLVLPSLSEGRPNVVLEAMASGLPVIATPVGAVPALIDPPREGLLVPAGNVDALADALTLLVNDANMRADMGRNARARIEREAISWDKTAEEFERIFAAAVAGKRPLPLLP